MPCGLYSMVYGSIELTVNLLHVCDELENLVRVTNLVVVPRNYLNELVCEIYTSVCVEDRSQSAAEEIRRNYSVLCVAEYTLELALRSLLHSSADLLLSSSVLEVNCEVNYRNVESRNTH